MMTDTVLRIQYSKVSSRELREMILHRDEDSEYAAYYLLRYRMKDKLLGVYHTVGASEEFYDILMDFYLYLRDGKDRRNKVPFQDIEGLRTLIAFESWIIATFKYFLLDRIALDGKQETAKEEIKSETPGIYDSKKDRRISLLAILLAKAQEVFVPRDLFIFYRSLLSYIDKEKAISSKSIAEAMGLTYDNYRQISTRTRQLATCALAKMETAGHIELSEYERNVADMIYENFESLFDIIAQMYEDVLEKLECKKSIQALRETCRDQEEDSSNIRFHRTDLFDESAVAYKRSTTENPMELAFMPQTNPSNLQLFEWDENLYDTIAKQKIGTNLCFLDLTSSGKSYCEFLERLCKEK